MLKRPPPPPPVSLKNNVLTIRFPDIEDATPISDECRGF